MKCHCKPIGNVISKDERKSSIGPLPTSLMKEIVKSTVNKNTVGAVIRLKNNSLLPVLQAKNKQDPLGSPHYSSL